MRTFEMTPMRRRWLHAKLDQVMNEMEKTQDLHGGFSELIKPVETSVRGVKVEVDLSLLFTPLDEHGNKVPAALFRLEEPSIATTKYCKRCNTLDAVVGKDHCGYCLQLSPEDRAKPFTQEEADTIRW